MDFKSKVFKRKSGKSEGKWTVRIEYIDSITEQKKTIERIKKRRVDAIDLRDRLIGELKKTHGQIHKGEKMIFSHLADLASHKFYKPAVIVEGRKIEGVRSYNTAQSYLKILKEFFGRQKIGAITAESLKDYRRWRLAKGSRRPAPGSKKKVPLKLSTINRELSALRRIMRYAFAQGWVSKDIFFGAEIIERSAEMERTRLLTQTEEVRLLDACQGERPIEYERTRFGKTETITATISVDNPHLKAIILLAIDAGMRRGEILKLRWKDLDFDAGLIQIIGTHTKTERERLAPLTERVKTELNHIREFSSGENPFPFSDFKRSWATAKRIAGIEDLHFHDLRRTALTRWQQFGLPLALAGKMAGHTNLQTTMKHYTSNDAEMVRDIAGRMNASNLSLESKKDGFIN